MEALLYGGQKRFLNDVVLKVATLPELQQEDVTLMTAFSKEESYSILIQVLLHFVLHRKTVYRHCTFERVKLRNFGIADFYNCTFINCDFQTAFIAASFAHCNFIGEVANCVFCGPQYNRYYYGNRLDYWASNKGRLHDVDLTKASLIDVDFRGGIDLSTTKFPTDYETDR